MNGADHFSRETMQWADERERGFQAAVFRRMVFSCLVDADFLSTERFLDASRAEQRSSYPGVHAEQILDYFVQG